MFDRSYFRAKNSISLEICLEEIRFLELTYFKKQISISQAKILTLPDKGSVKDYLKSLAKETATQGKQVSIAIPAEHTYIKRISLERGLKKIEQMAEIQDQLVCDFQNGETEFLYDYVLLNRTERKENFLLVAAQKILIQSYVEIIREAGWVVHYVDLDMYALARMAQFSLKKSEILQVYVHWDQTAAHCIMIYENEVIFYREILSNMISEIKDHLQYGLQVCKERDSSLSCQSIYLSRTAAMLASHIQLEGFQVKYLDPFQNINVPIAFEPILPQLYLALGLALRGLHA